MSRWRPGLIWHEQYVTRGLLLVVSEPRRTPSPALRVVRQVDDGGRQIDSSQIARGRLNRSADITTAHLNTEDYLASGRHGEWAGGSAARWVGQGGWGSSVLPPGMKGGSKEAATYLNAISAQQRR